MCVLAIFCYIDIYLEPLNLKILEEDQKFLENGMLQTWGGKYNIENTRSDS